jgi:hypothetical protein
MSRKIESEDKPFPKMEITLVNQEGFHFQKAKGDGYSISMIIADTGNQVLRIESEARPTEEQAHLLMETRPRNHSSSKA